MTAFQLLIIITSPIAHSLSFLGPMNIKRPDISMSLLAARDRQVRRQAFEDEAHVTQEAANAAAKEASMTNIRQVQ
jgi:hypothetical protein